MSAKLILTMRYKDAPSAIKWLCGAFGFKEQLIVPGAPGKITHAQLVYRNSMIMVGSLKEKEYSDLVSVPANVNGLNTQSAYLIAENIEGHYEHAIAKGANIILPLEDQDYGGKLYTCTDPEGYLWSFGSYNPWE